MTKKELTKEQFKVEFRKYHICGIPLIPYDLAYSSDCPKCEPTLGQWERTCEEFYSRGRTYWNGYYWEAIKK